MQTGLGRELSRERVSDLLAEAEEGTRITPRWRRFIGLRLMGIGARLVGSSRPLTVLEAGRRAT